MKKLSLMIALGFSALFAIAKPQTNTSQFESYTRQMQEMSAKYIAQGQFDNAALLLQKWQVSYESIPQKERAAYNTATASVLYNQAVAYTNTNEMYKALKSLKAAVNAGFDVTQAQNDPNLEKLKVYDEFKKILSSKS